MPEFPETSESLILRVRDPSNQAAWQEFEQLYRPVIFRIARAKGLQHADALDLVQQVLLSVSSAIDRYTDFGVARAMDDASMTQTGVIAGTPQYMSPEQARGEFVDHRSDLFSLGSILYTACTGRPPFRSEAAYGILRRITDTDPRPIREINPDTPQWLCRVIQRLMAKHPADRFQSADEVAELLEGCLAHLQQPSQVALAACVAAGQQADEIEHAPQSEEPFRGSPAKRRTRFQRTGIWVTASSIVLAAVAFVAFQMTHPADISGQWTGENWKNVSLLSVEEAADWYTGSFTDAEGRRGALQLEWSRLQRRYNGRWKVGDEQSGSITLRVGDAGTVRGAVSADPDSRTRSNEPRLRDFSWKRTLINQTRFPTPIEKRSVVRSQAVRIPFKGVVVRLGENVSENARIKKGDLIAVVTDLSDQRRVRQEQQVSAAEKRVEAAEASWRANQRNLEALKPIVEACHSQVTTYQQIRKQVVKSADAETRSAGALVLQAEKKLTELKAALTEARDALKRQQSQEDENDISQEQALTLELSVESMNVKVEAATADLRVAEGNLATQQMDAKASAQKAQVGLNSAVTEWKKAEADVVAAENEAAKALADWTHAKQERLELNQNQRELLRLNIIAPFDGVVTQITPIEGSQTPKEGDTICRITPDSPEDELQASSPNHPNPVPGSSHGTKAGL